MRLEYLCQRIKHPWHSCAGGIIITLLILGGCSKLEQGSQRLNPVESQFHESGWTDPTASGFHGKIIAAQHYSMIECQSCHGTDYKGGTTTSTCFDCHQHGPEACNTCHGSSASIAPPKDLSGNTGTNARGVGAHQKHLKTGVISAGYKCATCHLPPKSFADPVHISQTSTGAPILFTDSLAYTASRKSGEVHLPQPVYDRTTGSCSDTYCHGSFEGGNMNNTVTWNAPNQAACGTCHGDPATGDPLPMEEHLRSDLLHNCQGCHFIQDSTAQRLPVAERLPDGSYRIDIPSAHVNGKLNLVGGEIEIGAKRIE